MTDRLAKAKSCTSAVSTPGSSATVPSTATPSSPVSGEELCESMGEVNLKEGEEERDDSKTVSQDQV